ncbi:hypothetical protein KI387_027637, partial [Taxus chinensis]
ERNRERGGGEDGKIPLQQHRFRLDLEEALESPRPQKQKGRCRRSTKVNQAAGEVPVMPTK